VPPKTECDDRELDSLDAKGRPGAITTVTMATFAEVFPGRNFAGNNISGVVVGSYDTEVLKERKIILYQYGDTQVVTWGTTAGNMSAVLTAVVFGLGIANLNTVTNNLPIILADPDIESPVLTVTISIQFAGVIYPQLGVNTALRCASIQIESERTKLIYKPRGTVREAYGADYTMVASPRETIAEDSASKPRIVPGRAKGQPQTANKCLEKAKQPEPRQVAPQWSMETVPVRGEAEIVPQNWTPLIQLPKIEDFGFVPSQAHADALAVQVAARCARESDPWRVVMPIAPEWISGGCPPYFRCHLHDAHYEAIAARIVQTQEGRTTLEFQANRIGPAPIVPNQPPALPFIPRYQLGAAPPGGGPAPIVQPLQLTVSAGAIVGIAGDQIGPIIVQASGGNP
jgi:hypothetical protein